MSEQSRRRARAAVLFLAPVVFVAGILAHPFVRTYLESHVVAEAVRDAPGQWLAAHLTIAVGIGLVLVAVVVIRGEFRAAGEQRWSVVGTPALLVGGALLAAVVGAEVTLAAVVDTGGDVHAVLETGVTFPPFLAGMALFALGWLCFAVAFYRVPLLPMPLNWLVIAASVAIPVAALAIPQTTGAYVYGLAVLVVSWLVGYRVLTQPLAASDMRASA